MLFQMRFRTLFTLLLSLIAPAGSASADMCFNFENRYKCVLFRMSSCIGKNRDASIPQYLSGNPRCFVSGIHSKGFCFGETTANRIIYGIPGNTVVDSLPLQNVGYPPTGRSRGTSDRQHLRRTPATSGAGTGYRTNAG